MSATTYVSTRTTSVATCPASTRLTAGGANILGGPSNWDASIRQSYPSAIGLAGKWTAVMQGSGSGGPIIQAYAICMP